MDRISELTSEAPAPTPGRGALYIVGSTVISGIAGYLVTFFVFRGVGPASYAVFAVFWAALYLVVGGLSGIQQEITRATHRIELGTRATPSRARRFAIVTAAIIFVAVVLSSLLWAPAVFRVHPHELVWPLAVATASYVLIATLSGSLYGVAAWRSLALLVTADGVLRLALVGVGLLFTHDIVALAWAVALPFPLAIALLWRAIRPGFVGRSELDVGYRALVWNVARTVLASISTAVLVSGFPLLLGVTSRTEPAALVGQLVFTITLTRAPLIVSVMALQSFFVVRFRDAALSATRTLALLLGIIAVGALVLAALGWWLGEPVLRWVSGVNHGVDGPVIAVLVLSSGLVAALSLTGARALAESRHLVYSLGWCAAALVTVVVMFSPLPFVPRVEAALLVGPVVGLVVYLVAFVVPSKGEGA